MLCFSCCNSEPPATLEKADWGPTAANVKVEPSFPSSDGKLIRAGQVNQPAPRCCPWHSPFSSLALLWLLPSGCAQRATLQCHAVGMLRLFVLGKALLLGARYGHLHNYGTHNYGILNFVTAGAAASSAWPVTFAHPCYQVYKQCIGI